MNDRIVEALSSIHDPCCRERDLSIVDMGLVRSADVDGDHAHVELMLTSGWCPFASNILESARERIQALDGIERASVDITFDEAWTMDRLSDEARKKLVFLPEPSAIGDRDAYIQRHSSAPASPERGGGRRS
jgi:metal-sulfur cluster biosynthetic enzyme